MEADVIIAARLLQFSGTLTLFGAAWFYLYAVPSASAALPVAAPSRHRASSVHRALLPAAAAAGLLGSVLWIMGETASFSGEPSDAVNPAAVWAVLWDTRFGHACLVRIILLVLSILAGGFAGRLKGALILQALLGGAATLTFAWTGHGASGRGMAGALHLAADLAHLLAAGAWIGALAALVLLTARALRSKSAISWEMLRIGLDRFSAIGVAVVAVIVLSGIVNTGFLIGISRWTALFTTSYGVVLLVKLALFGGMLVLAALNRYRLAPAMGLALCWSLFTETLLALMVLLAVSVLGMLEPPMSGN